MLRVIAAALVLNCAALASAGHIGGGFGFGGRGLEFGLGGHHGYFDGFGGLGIGVYGAERVQERFENRYEDLTLDYEEGVAEIEDFYSSEEYAEIVDDTELLVDHYDFFVAGVERSVERLTDLIGIANDDLAYYNDLLAEYQADEDLSEARLERIENRIERITGHIDMRIDRLTDIQTTLEEDLPDYLSFQAEIGAFLTDILSAGGAMEETASAVAMYAMSAAVSVVDETAETSCPAQSNSLSGIVPEPASMWLIVPFAAMLAMSWRRRSR